MSVFEAELLASRNMQIAFCSHHVRCVAIFTVVTDATNLFWVEILVVYRSIYITKAAMHILLQPFQTWTSRWVAICNMLLALRACQLAQV